MMRSTFKTLFYINRQKTKANGLTSILCRITIDGKNSVITTNEECKPAEWNAKQGITTDKKTNLRLQSFREQVEKTYQELLLKDGVISAELLKNRLQGIATSPTTLLELSNTELQSVKEGVGKSKAEGTYTNLCYANRMLCEFIKDLGGKDIEIRSITEELFEEYRFFLKKKGLKGSSINNYLCWLSRLMFRAVSQRIIRYNPFEHAEYEKVEKAIRFLSKSDVANLMAMKMCDSDAELARFFGVTWRKVSGRLRAITEDSILSPDERNAGERKIVTDKEVKGYAPLYPLPTIIALSFQLDCVEAHLFRRHVCSELMRQRNSVIPIIIYDRGVNS